MLITIVDTKSYGKFVLHKYPYQQIQVEHQGFQKLPLNQILQTISDTFGYFAIYRKKQLISTSNQPLPEKAVVQIFMANQKNSQIVLGIDDGCVLVSRSVFLKRRRCQQAAVQTWVSSDNAAFVDVNEDNQSIVNSISLVWRLESYDGVEEAKHRLSFLIGVLQRKEQHSNFLTKQINKIMQEKQHLKRRIKDLFTINTRDSTQPFQQIRIKILAREIHEETKRVRERIALFRMLKEYYESWIKGTNFQVKEEEGVWEGTIGGNIVIQTPTQEFLKNIQHRTLVMLPPKLAQFLPNVLYSNRVKKLYDKGFAFNNLSFKKLFQKNSDLNKKQLYHTAYFLLRNNLAVDMYPFDYPHSYNLYYLKDLPSRHLIQKFNNRIFPGRNFLQIIQAYSKYKIAKQEQQTLKYLLLKDIVGEVKIFIYHKQQKEGQEDKAQNPADSMLEQMLENKYNMTEHDLNYLLAVQPPLFCTSKENNMLNNIIKFVKDHSKQWGFYFVQ